MWRTRAPAVYGFKTMCYGTLLPAPLIGAAAPEIPGLIGAAGHEVGLHGYDHVRWHDQLFRLPVQEISREIEAAQQTLAALWGRRADSFAGPGWQCSEGSRQVQAAQHFLYASDTRGPVPYFPRFGRMSLRSWKSPPPCPPWMRRWAWMAAGPEISAIWSYLALMRSGPRSSPFTLKWRGGRTWKTLPGLLQRGRRQGVEFFRLEDWGRELLQEPGKIPVAPVASRRPAPGRAGTVSCQGVFAGPPDHDRRQRLPVRTRPPPDEL